MGPDSGTKRKSPSDEQAPVITIITATAMARDVERLDRIGRILRLPALGLQLVCTSRGPIQRRADLFVPTRVGLDLSGFGDLKGLVDPAGIGAISIRDVDQLAAPADRASLGFGTVRHVGLRKPRV